MEIGGPFGIFANYEVVELAAGRVVENGADNEGRGAALQVFKVNALGLGQSDPVRQLEKAGIVNKRILQHLQIHISLEQLVYPVIIFILGQTNGRQR